MQRYVNKADNTVCYIQDIRSSHPEMSIPEDADCSEIGYEFLIQTTPPKQDGYDCIELPPVDNVQQWELREKSVVVPKVITMAQCREQLILLGLDDEVEAMLESIPDLITKKRYKSAWEYETIVKIDNAMLLELAPLLGIDIDKFFIDASKL